MDKSRFYVSLGGILLLSIMMFSSGYILANRAGKQGEAEYKKVSLDLSYPYIGVRPVSLRYLYSLKQGIFKMGTAEITVGGRVKDIGPRGDVLFRIHLQHITDSFENTITPDTYNNAVVIAKHESSGLEVPIHWKDIQKDEVIEMTFTLDFMSGVEDIKNITVFRD